MKYFKAIFFFYHLKTIVLCLYCFFFCFFYLRIISFVLIDVDATGGMNAGNQLYPRNMA